MLKNAILDAKKIVKILLKFHKKLTKKIDQTSPSRGASPPSSRPSSPRPNPTLRRRPSWRGPARPRPALHTDRIERMKFMNSEEFWHFLNLSGSLGHNLETFDHFLRKFVKFRPSNFINIWKKRFTENS